jgi:hypothetical protein
LFAKSRDIEATPSRIHAARKRWSATRWDTWASKQQN